MNLVFYICNIFIRQANSTARPQRIKFSSSYEEAAQIVNKLVTGTSRRPLNPQVFDKKVFWALFMETFHCEFFPMYKGFPKENEINFLHYKVTPDFV